MIAVTGAAGFIGSNLAHRLAAMEHEILLVDDALTAAKMNNWVGLRAFRFVSHDVFLNLLGAGSLRPAAVFHLGACSSTTETNWNYLRRNNVEYSQFLWNWCVENECPFIYASSAATYGDGSLGFDDRTPPAALHPLNLYGRSKNDFDLWALQQCEQDAAPPRWAGLKFFNVYGPREQHKGRMASVVWQAYRQIQESGSVRLFRSTHPDFPDGGQKRDFVYVGDCIDHMLWLWNNPAESAVYNSGSGMPRTFLDLVHAVFAALEMTPRVQFIDMPTDLIPQYQNYTCAPMGKLRAQGCDLPGTSLEEGVATYIQFLQSGIGGQGQE